MIGKIILGALAGFVAVRAIARWRSGGCGQRGGCGRGGWRRGRWGFAGPRQVMWLMHELRLDHAQRDEVGEILKKVGRAFGALRADLSFGRLRALDDLHDILGADSFDRARVEGAFQRHADTLAALQKEMVDGLARLHEILTPAQRARLRELVGQMSGHDRPDAQHTDGPYR